ncbi:MAG: glycosyltransferase family 2 protein [Dysgonamonadaceae bacterium]|jgi:glycosyltransferase involved in cell wall biosynthesis|nr:glycosyltransferase family 2 protein [Dysgonamonadaceae bacterium]
MKPTVNILLPCYNPPPDWVDTVLKYYAQLQAMLNDEVKLRLTVVNDGSEYNMEEERQKRLVRNIPDSEIISYPENKGKGYALRYGLHAVKARNIIQYLIYSDWDFPFESKCMKDMITALLEGADVVVGKRNDSYCEQLTLKRKMMSNASKWLNKRLLNLPDCDSQSGLKGMSSKGCEIFLQTKINQFLFDTEFVFKANHCKDICLQVLPVHIRQGINMSNMGVNILRKEALNFLRILFRCV